ncbi:MAG TPA: isopentenyl-diphosphate Delta-isomerase [Gemmatimonadaceae bacterium]|nr:isopentenyl-diphosphate Delta-isomerase [Gemmatimonadaceae bacterium]
MASEEVVVLVDEQDRERGVMDKLRAHVQGALHRAVSVVVTDSSGRMLLQQRARNKYHGGGLWSNTCCGHPRLGEAPREAAVRRLREEMGLACALRPVATFVYRAAVGPLIEHEVDHVFAGTTDEPPDPDPDEVMAWRAEPLDRLANDLAAHPERYSPWLPHVLDAMRRAGDGPRA